MFAEQDVSQEEQGPLRPDEEESGLMTGRGGTRYTMLTPCSWTGRASVQMPHSA